MKNKLSITEITGKEGKGKIAAFGSEGGEVKMEKYRFCLIVNDKKLNDIFKRMAKAKEEIEKCYEELRTLDLIGILPETTSCPKEQEAAINQK